MKKTNFPSWPSYSVEEINAVKKVLLSNKVNYWTGDECRKFEKEFALFANTDYAIALANGTLAIEAALKSLDIGIGDEVIVTSRTFLASVSSIINSGAKPVFADVNYYSQNIDAQTIKPVLSKKTKAIMCVHLAGWPCDMDPIMRLADEHRLFVIEDCAQAHGAKYKGQPVGSIGDVGAWSFCQDKIITTGGEGGMITTNNKEIWSKIWSYKDHGKSWEAVYKKKHAPGFRWLHDSFGTNLRMTEMQAVIGRIQLKRIEKWNVKRLKNATAIWDAARKSKIIRVPNFFPCDNCDQLSGINCSLNCKHAAYKCYIFVKGNSSLRDKMIDAINKRGIPCFSGSCSEVYLENAFKDTNFKPKKRLPIAKKLGETSLMFLCNPNLTKKDIKKTCTVISEVSKLFEV